MPESLQSLSAICQTVSWVFEKAEEQEIPVLVYIITARQWLVFVTNSG